MEEELGLARDPGEIVGKADLTEADVAHILTQLPGAKRPWLVPVILAAGMLLGLLLNPPQVSQTLTFLLTLLFVVALTVYFRRANRRAWIKQAFVNVGGSTTFRFDAYGFSSESGLRQHRLAWSSLSRSIETPQAFLVYTTPGTVLTVPKRAFTDDEVVTLSGLLRERITAKPAQNAGLFAGGLAPALLMWGVLLVAFLAIWLFLNDGAAPSRTPAQRQVPESASRPASGEASDVDSSP